MKSLKIDMDLIKNMFCRKDTGENNYVDTETGEIIHPTEENKNNFPDRYKKIPSLSKLSYFVMMVNFANSMEDQALKEKLLTASANKEDPMKEYNEVLQNYPVEYEQWQDFQHREIAEEIQQWLNSLGIQAL